MTKENLKKISILIDRWGVASQLVMTIKEAGRLQVVCSKILRGKIPRTELVDALGDMYVMMQTLCTMYGITGDDLDRIATKKLDYGMMEEGLQKATRLVEEDEMRGEDVVSDIDML